MKGFNAWASVFAAAATALVIIGIQQHDVTWSAAGIVAAIFALAES